MNSCEFAQNLYEIRTNSYEFMPMDRRQACRVLPLFVLGAVWAWWMRLGRDFLSVGRWVMKLGHEFYPLKSLKSNQKYGPFSQKTSKFG